MEKICFWRTANPCWRPGLSGFKTSLSLEPWAIPCLIAVPQRLTFAARGLLSFAASPSFGLATAGAVEPHAQVYAGEPKAGTAPPFRLARETGVVNAERTSGSRS